ncbi:hypothetical protein KEM09_00370 [Carboxylicivirga mesophila]|uniref:Uncharacterized protein n=1 Tax=Carboxylicivirga mesophila TaxID=1166478 RepID=A0ABS5K4D6_9BACT|nr:hypothetical protein [Carboxylicivirga mesophila]MBS2209837.1 hypothetical protein [Carboxylicivirga mesophila]
MRNIRLSWLDSIRLEVVLGRFVPPVMILLSAIGFFIRKVWGWVLWVAFYYYISIFPFILATNLDGIFGGGLILFIVSVLIIALNMPYIRQKFNVGNSSLLTINLLAILIAMVANSIHGYIIASYHITLSEALTKIGY